MDAKLDGSRRCVVMLVFIAFGRMVKWLCSLTLIQTLLVMAGIEQNPGPLDEFIFHYQYLLIEIGTDVMRKVFDTRVGYNFGKYLITNIKERTKLQSLILAKIITTDQTKYLPPIDKKPNSTNFDITLLACLLRNVCGLRGHTDPVWKNPQPNDFSLEADLARLKECRNHLHHMGTVRIAATASKIKWAELTQILTRLNHTAGIQNLSSLINDVKQKPIDLKLKQAYDDAIRASADTDKFIDRGIEDLKHSQSEMIRRQSEIIRRQSEIKDGHSKLDQGQCELKLGMSELRTSHTQMREVMSSVENLVKKQQEEFLQERSKTHRDTIAQVENIQQTRLHGLTMDESDLRNRLIKLYQEECCTLPVSPLCLGDEDEIELLTIYQRPNMCRIPYHRSQMVGEKYHISSYRKLLFKDYDGKCENCFTNIHITGDAGVGKTSFCKCMALLWCKQGEHIVNNKLQKDVNLMKMFDFVFYISLGKTVHEDVIDMIIDQCFYTRSKDSREETVKIVECILKNKICVIILDGLDEWSPHINETKYCALPKKFPSEMCIYITTSRPYKIEHVRLSQKDLDIQVQMTGLSKQSTIVLVTRIVNHINDKTRDNKNPDDFIWDIKRLGLQNQLRIPLIAAHLIEVWFDHTLADMSRALLYSNIVNMLLKRAENRHIMFPPSRACSVYVPGALSMLGFVTKYCDILEKVCLLSFRSLFKHDKHMLALVFTEEQLMSLPDFPTEDELNCLCKVGILSKNKMMGKFGRQEQQISFLHKSYLEYFAALYVSSFDSKYEFANVVRTWTSINDVVQYSHFFRFLVGLSYKTTEHYINSAYKAISEDLASCRKNAIFHYDSDKYSNEIQSLHTMAINCFTEISRLNHPNISCRLKDFIFDNNSPDVELLKQLLLLNKAYVKSIYSVNGNYLDEFGSIHSLECLHVDNSNASSTELNSYCVFMLRNASTLSTVSIDSDCIPIEKLQHLTSLCITTTNMPHYRLQNLVQFLSTNRRMEHIKLVSVNCYDHRDVHRYRDCTMTLDLPYHTRLASLYIWDVNIVCRNVNKARLMSVSLYPLYEDIVRCYTNIFKHMHYSNLEHININGREHTWLTTNMMTTLFRTVKALPKLKFLKLEHMDLPNDVLIQFHPGIQRVQMQLDNLTMHIVCFEYFFQHLLENSYQINSVLSNCILKRCSVYGKTLSEKESLARMSDILKLASDRYARKTIKFNLSENECQLYFETTKCQ